MKLYNIFLHSDLTQSFLAAVEKLKILIKLLPKEDELKELDHYEGNVAELSPVDQFLFSLSTTPHYKLLIEIGIAKTTFTENMNDYLPALQKYNNACEGKLKTHYAKDKIITLIAKFFYILKKGNFFIKEKQARL